MSWNHTCAISRTPIVPGQSAYIILLADRALKHARRNRTGINYPTDRWYPIALPMLVQYQGGNNVIIHQHHQWKFERFARAFELEDLDRPEGTTKSLPDFVDAIHSGRLESSTNPAISFMLVHKAMWDIMSEAIRDPDSDEDTLVSASDIVSLHGSKFWISLNHVHHRGVDLKNFQMLRDALAPCARAANLDNLFTEWFAGPFNTPYGTECVVPPEGFPLIQESLSDIYWSKIKKDRFEITAAPLLKETAQLMIFNRNMQDLHIAYQPTMIASDSYRHDLASQIHEFAQSLDTEYYEEGFEEAPFEH